MLLVIKYQYACSGNSQISKPPKKKSGLGPPSKKFLALGKAAILEASGREWQHPYYCLPRAFCSFCPCDGDDGLEVSLWRWGWAPACCREPEFG
jgi:hypothetical protein